MESKELIQVITCLTKCVETLSNDLHELINAIKDGNLKNDIYCETYKDMRRNNNNKQSVINTDNERSNNDSSLDHSTRNDRSTVNSNGSHGRQNVNTPLDITTYATNHDSRNVNTSTQIETDESIDPAVHDIQRTLALAERNKKSNFPPCVFRSKKHFKIDRTKKDTDAMTNIIQQAFAFYANRNDFKHKDDYTLFATVYFDLEQVRLKLHRMPDIKDISVGHVNDYELIAKAINMPSDLMSLMKFVSNVINVFHICNSENAERLNHYEHLLDRHSREPNPRTFMECLHEAAETIFNDDTIH